MKPLLTAIIAAASLSAAGCEEDIFRRDLTPPSSPRGLETATGDRVVELFWVPNSEPDVEGYKVYAATSLSGPYELIATTADEYFADAAVHNGLTYYYAVSAFDYAGNEGEMSRDVAYDTPRPEGYNVVLNNYRAFPERAGYDFSAYSVGSYDAKPTDVFFEVSDGQAYLDVWEDSDIQDMGYTATLGEIGAAPAGGWSRTKDVPVTVGHTYIVWSWDDHYAKIRVTSLSASRVVFDWAYQLQEGNPRLKRAHLPAPAGGVRGRSARPGVDF